MQVKISNRPLLTELLIFRHAVMLYDRIQGIGHDFPITENFPREYMEMHF